jgi:heme exporter protein C
MTWLFMWKLLYQLASPKAFYSITTRIVPWLAVSAFFALTLGFIWGVGFAPTDYQQGDAFRIIYVHGFSVRAFVSLAD